MLVFAWRRIKNGREMRSRCPNTQNAGLSVRVVCTPDPTYALRKPDSRLH